MRTLLLVSIFFLHFCTTNSQPGYLGTTRPLHPVNELWINGGLEPSSIDPNKINGDPEINLSSNMFVRLVQTHPVTGEILPDLATSWEISNDGLTYIFHLRKDAKWSDGKPLTAHDVEFSWKRLMNPATGAVNASMTDVIENAQAYRTTKLPLEKVGVKAKDDFTLLVKLNSPVSYFLSMIEYVIFAPLPEHLIEKLKVEKKEDQWTKPENIVVSGPFKIKEERFKQFRIFEKNTFYYHADQVRLNRVKTLVIEGYKADLNAYKTGQHDWSCCNSVPSEMISQLQTQKDFYTDPYLALYFFMTNTNKKPLNDARVRKALSLAIDRKSIVENVARGGQMPTRDLVPPGTFGYKGIKSSLYDVPTAQKLLAEAGFPNGQNFPKLQYKYNSGEIHLLIAQAVQQMWKKNLNIDIVLINEEWAVLQDDQKSGNFEITRRAWIADYIDPYSFVNVLISNGTNNKSGWKNKTYDELVAASNHETNTKKRFAFFEKVEKILEEEQPFIPLYVYTRLYMKKPFLKGFWPNLLNRHEWKYMWIDEQWNENQKEDLPNQTWF